MIRGVDVTLTTFGWRERSWRNVEGDGRRRDGSRTQHSFATIAPGHHTNKTQSESESKTLTIIIIRVIRLRDRLEESLRIMVILPFNNTER